MRYIFIFLPIGIFAGCNAPPTEFRSLPATSIEVEQSVFDVRYVGDRALALRTNSENAIGENGITARGVEAIKAVSGCEVIGHSVRSDKILISADLIC